MSKRMTVTAEELRNYRLWVRQVVKDLHETPGAEEDPVIKLRESADDYGMAENVLGEPWYQAFDV